MVITVNATELAQELALLDVVNYGYKAYMPQKDYGEAREDIEGYLKDETVTDGVAKVLRDLYFQRIDHYFEIITNKAISECG